MIPLPTPVHSVIDHLGRRRSTKLVNRFAYDVPRGACLLDIGPGGGWISEELKLRRQVSPTLVDVTDFGMTRLPVQTYDGETLPYGDDTFDVALLVYTLHHCAHPDRVLREAVRVTRRRLVIVEDTPHSRASHANVVLWDVVSNIPTFIVPPGMHMPLNFRSRAAWRQVFTDLGLKLVREEGFVRSRLVHKTLFVLDVDR